MNPDESMHVMCERRSRELRASVPRPRQVRGKWQEPWAAERRTRARAHDQGPWRGFYPERVLYSPYIGELRPPPRCLTI